MGYLSRVEGGIEFSRPLNNREAAPLVKIMGDPWNIYELVREEEERETDEGILTIVRTYGIRSQGDEFKAYEWESVLRRLIEALPEGITAEGRMERSGEDAGDMERLYVKGRKVISVKPEIHWKDPFQ